MGTKITASIRSAKSTTKQAAKKAAARPGPRADKADGESAVLAKIAAMPGPYRAMGERLHALIKASAPGQVAVDVRGMPVKQDRKSLRLPPGTLNDRGITGGGRSLAPPHPRPCLIPVPFRCSARYTCYPQPAPYQFTAAA